MTNEILTIIGTGATVVGLIYAILRNFKTDINDNINLLNKRMDKFEDRLISMDERLFFLATGEHLDEVIKRERINKEKIK